MSKKLNLVEVAAAVGGTYVGAARNEYADPKIRVYKINYMKKETGKKLLPEDRSLLRDAGFKFSGADHIDYPMQLTVDFASKKEGIYVLLTYLEKTIFTTILDNKKLKLAKRTFDTLDKTLGMLNDIEADSI